jgi:hypothetical protein
MDTMRRRQKHKSKRNDLVAMKDIDNAGVDFFPFLLGMVTSLAVILLIWNQWMPLRATENQAARPPIQKPAKESDRFDLDAHMASGDPLELANLIFELEQSLEGKMPAEQVELNRQCIQVADRMLTMALTSQQQALAKNTKLSALARIYGLNYVYKNDIPNIESELRETAIAYLLDSNPLLVRDAGLALLKVNVFELAKLPSTTSPKPIADEIVGLLKQHPEDEYVMSTIRLVLDSCLIENERNGLSLIKSLNEQKNEFASDRIKAIFQDCSDKALLIESRYQKRFDDRWVNGAFGQEELLKLSSELVKNPDSGPLLIAKVDEVAHWFEQENRHENAIQIYDAMLNASENGMHAVANDFAKKTAEAGMRRNKLVNTKIDLSGFAPDGSMILPEEFNNRVVVVIYWSNHDANSIAGLQQFHEETKSWRSKSIAVVAVCVDDNSVNDVIRLATKLTPFRFMVGDPAGNGTNHVLEQCPSTRVPRAMLIGKDGIVVDVNVPLGELKTDAEGIL